MTSDAGAPVTVVVAPDAFKGTVTAAEAADAIAAGVRDVLGPDAHVVTVPVADGGEGSLDALLAAWGVDAREVDAPDAIGRPGRARYGVSSDGRTAVLELAQASGLPAVSDVALQPERSDTTGTGEVAARALDDGVDEVLLCLGGSASTDGGTGILRGLGARFLDAGGAEVAPGGGHLADIATVDLDGLHPRAREVTWRLAVDVTNPLCGERGSAAVFGPQKGADPATVARLDTGLGHLADVLADVTGDDVREVPGAGAAGGVPAGLVPVLGAELVPGATMIAEAAGLPAHLETADLVFTGEGRFDAQSIDGKVPSAVAGLVAGRCPVVVLAGGVDLDRVATRAAGITAALSIAPGPVALADLAPRTAARLRAVAADVTALVTGR